MKNTQPNVMDESDLLRMFECRIEKLKYYGLIAVDLENNLDDALVALDSTDRYKYDLPIYNANRNDHSIIEGIRSDLELQAYIKDIENTLELVGIVKLKIQ